MKPTDAFADLADPGRDVPGLEVATWLIDKSALVRLAAGPDAAEWAARIERGLVRITAVTRLEAGYSVRSGPQLRAGFQRPPLSSMPAEYLTPSIEDRAVEILTLLADRSASKNAPTEPESGPQGRRTCSPDRVIRSAFAIPPDSCCSSTRTTMPSRRGPGPADRWCRFASSP